MEVALAHETDLPDYIAFARKAQASLRSKGLAQWVPAAHAPYEATLAGQIAQKTLHVVRRRGASVAFFVLSEVPSEWWGDEATRALYLSGIVVDEASKGLDIGRQIVAWATEQARARGARAVRLDCHAGNPWLRSYYEGLGFVGRGRIEQHPGYEGCLYEYAVEEGPGS